jgi:hypothetical protein
LEHEAIHHRPLDGAAPERTHESKLNEDTVVDGRPPVDDRV